MDIETVKKVARLSRIKVTDDRATTLQNELSGIIKFVELLEEVDTTGIEPLSSVANVTLPLREDVINDGNQQEAILANAPEKSHGFFVVPKVVG